MPGRTIDFPSPEGTADAIHDAVPLTSPAKTLSLPHACPPFTCMLDGYAPIPYRVSIARTAQPAERSAASRCVARSSHFAITRAFVLLAADFAVFYRRIEW